MIKVERALALRLDVLYGGYFVCPRRIPCYIPSAGLFPRWRFSDPALPLTSERISEIGRLSVVPRLILTGFAEASAAAIAKVMLSVVHGDLVSGSNIADGHCRDFGDAKKAFGWQSLFKHH